MEDKIFEIEIGELVEVGENHTIVLNAIDVGRWAHRLYIKENDNGLRVNHIVTVFNRDCMAFGNRVHLKGPDLASILAAGTGMRESLRM